MSLDQVTAFFGWMSVLNMAVLLISWLAVMALKPVIMPLHQRLLGLEGDALNRLYVHYLAIYKLLIFVFNLAPYIALRLIA